MCRLALTTFILLASAAFVMAEYRYYYRRPSGLRSLSSKISHLEDEVDSLKNPVHVHVHTGDDEDHSAHAHLEGAHVHVHLSVDGLGYGLSSNDWTYATCKLTPNTGDPIIEGFVYLRQKPTSQLDIKMEIKGFPRRAKYGFHVHEVADFTNGCSSFGGHYNPYGQTHGGPTDVVRHVGDWGNIQANNEGEVEYDMTDGMASLFGKNSIVGRGIVVHAGQDDLGRGGDAESKKTGNAGRRLACCVIGWAKEGHW